jgi:hypothetical protein
MHQVFFLISTRSHPHHGRDFDSIFIHPADAGPTHSVGYIMIFDDPVLHPKQGR